MNCSIDGCPGSYETKEIVHTIKKGDEIIVFEKVPAEICNVCSDILLTPETVRHIEALMTLSAEPERHAPVYAYR